MDTVALKTELLPKFLQLGDERFYRFLLVLGAQRIVSLEKGEQVVFPNLELLEFHDQFVILNRREADDRYLQIAKVFRRAAHKIYRLMVKRNLIEPNPRFLRAV